MNHRKVWRPQPVHYRLISWITGMEPLQAIAWKFRRMA